MLRRPMALRTTTRRSLAVLAVAGLLPGCSDEPGRITRAGPSAGPTTETGTAEPRPTTTAGRDLDGSSGAVDAADALVPGAGNGGYDVARYDLDIEVSDDRRSITATATIEATATQDLSAFNLDLAGLTVGDVEVDGEAATIVHTDDELTVTPAQPVPDGDEFTVAVAYSGSPRPVADPSAPGTIGWLTAPSGTYVASEPTGAKGFFPANDHPSDKAVFDIAVTAADRDTVVANGVLASKESAGSGRTRWAFTQTDPMATYLVQIAVGDYDVVESTSASGVPIRHAIVWGVPADRREVLDDTGPQLDFFESLFGPYPLDNYGLLVADSLPEFALETQTLTLLPAEWLEGGRESTSAVMAHELAHQWFGDSVTPQRWTDIWLNEGFATYGEWLWNDHVGARTLDAEVTATLGQVPRWREVFGPVAEPAPEFLFSPNQYGGAAVVLHALRLTVGDDVFFGILRTWATDFGGTSATTEDFEALATRRAGRDLTPFFDSWLRSTSVPPLPA